MYKIQFILPLALVMLLMACQVSKKTIPTSGNPIFEGWYADPEGVILDHKFWIYPTFSANYEDQVFLDAFSSVDLVNWEKHSHILDTTVIKWAKKAIWAPCIVKKDSSYFLFFSANDIQAPFRNGYVTEDNRTGGIGIGISSAPQGPFKDYLGKPLIQEFYNKAQPIDQFVFEDRDSQYYLIYGGWGHCNIARLQADFTALIPYTDGSIVKEITPEGYVEGPVMFLRKDKYYLMWSEGNWTDESYKVAYGISDTPFGPFIKQSTILETNPLIATGAGHHSVVKMPDTDDWYMIYHRRPIPNEGRDHRVVCIDRMFFNPDGTIQAVLMTKEGVSQIKISK